MEKKTIRVKNTRSGRNELQKKVGKLTRDGYVEVSRNVYGSTFKAGKGCCLGIIFLPLMLFGYESGEIEVVMEKKVVEK